MTTRMGIAQYRAMAEQTYKPKANKYGAKSAYRCMDCHAAPGMRDRCLSCESTNVRRFDSKAEARYYDELVIRRRIGEIHGIICQHKLAIDINGINVGSYRADFSYFEGTEGEGAERIYIDVKGGDATDTGDSKFRRRCVAAQYGINVEVVRR